MARQKRSDRRTLILALVLGLVAAGLVVAFLANVGQKDTASAPPAAVTMRSVVVAKKDIAVGSKIEESMLERKDIPESAVIAGAAVDFDEVVGEVARYPVAQGEQVNADRFVATNEVQALSFQIPAGKRGFTIPVEVNRSPAALLAPGDFVDVLVAGKLVDIGGGAAPTPAAGVAGDHEPKAVVTLLQNVQVLSVQREHVADGVPYDSTVRGDPPTSDSVSYVTLAVTPEQSQLLWLAGQDGAMTLTLRAFGDDKTSTLSPAVEPLRIGP